MRGRGGGKGVIYRAQTPTAAGTKVHLSGQYLHEFDVLAPLLEQDDAAAVVVDFGKERFGVLLRG
jgi:hypothetical protein